MALCAALWSAPVLAQGCAPASTQGTAPPGWETYCWLDFTTYNDATARSVAGQNFSITLSDGSILNFNLRVTPTTAAAFDARVAPSWTGSAVGNTAFLGIPGRPILYTVSAGAKSIVFSNITITPPPGVPAVTTYSFVAADGESTNNGENLQFVTNGSPWVILDQVNPISGSTYPTITGVGTNTFTETGVAGTVGGYIVGSTNPTTVTANMTAGGLQGAMFAVRFASIRLTKQIVGARVDPSDQFNFRITATGSGATLATGTTTGMGLGPFSPTPLSLASGIPLSLVETMAPGSSSALSRYRSTLTCTNSTASSTTPLPNNVVTTNYSFGALQFGDAVNCIFTNTPRPHIRLLKALGGTGRYYAADQFTPRIRNGATLVASATSTGTGAIITGGDTGMTQLVGGTAYTLDEIAGTGTDLSNYTVAMACTNSNTSSTTALTTAAPGTITPQIGDVITCTITNTRRPSNANLIISKSVQVISDPQNGTVNPKMIPGALVRYSLTVTNSGNLPVDASTVQVLDALPSDFLYNSGVPVAFTNGSTASGLNAFNAATMVSFSNAVSGAGPYGYTPSGGLDANIRGIRIAPTGTMAAATSASAQPSFTVTFEGQIK
jgi:uncharacterized repeat protein (TIGR01451 family)